MNKHHGGSIKDYLKEKGIYEEVNKLAQERWKELQENKSMTFDWTKTYTWLEFCQMFYKQYPGGAQCELAYYWNTYKLSKVTKR